ncbi:unnamed protein product [Haemonchus placei]|uniref:Uncharacterized protein n=1 Tax=Haemonchus placei TaxID=6290 RepID=A0A0N4WJI6_HAEPC|nr:unnamed protein product [Haemonchus placei]
MFPGVPRVWRPGERSAVGTGTLMQNAGTRGLKAERVGPLGRAGPRPGTRRLMAGTTAEIGAVGCKRRSAVASLRSCSTVCALFTACSNDVGPSSFTKYRTSPRRRETNSSKTRSF